VVHGTCAVFLPVVMSEGPVVRPLLDELARGTPKERVKALGELRRLAETEAVRSEFIVMGHAPKIVAVLKQGDVECRIRAAGVIANIAATDACRATVLAAGVLEPLVAMLTTGFSDFQDESAGALRSLAESEQGQHAIIASGALSALVDMLSNASPKGKVRAGGTIGYLAAHLPKAEVKGFLPGLVTMLSSDSQEVSTEATCAMWHIATTCPNRAAVVEAGALAPLIHLLSHSSLRGKAEAAKALGNLAEEGDDFEPNGDPPPAFAGAIVDAGATPGLVALLWSGTGALPGSGHAVDLAMTNNAYTQAARTLSMLATQSRTHSVLVGDGAIPALIRLLQDCEGCPMAKGWSASTLEQLARDADVKKEIYASVPLVAKTVGAQKLLTTQLNFYCQ
jgi:hypothetical protein